MPIFLIGLGLSDLDDVTIRGDKLIRSSCEIWLESYTSIFPNVSLSTLSERYPGIPVKIADRTIIESGFDAILQKAKTDKVAILIVGDPFSATTHSDLYIRAKKENVEIQVVRRIKKQVLLLFNKQAKQQFSKIGTQRINNECCRMLRTFPLRFWANHIHSIVSGQLATGQFLRSLVDELPIRIAHALLA